MIAISSVNELNKILRNVIIAQSELSAKRVVNTTSVYGETLDKLLSGKIFASYETTDSVILFELLSRDSSSDINFTEESIEEKIISYKSYDMNLIIYGNISADIGMKLESRFKTQKVLDDLQDIGVYVERVSNPRIINEFINNTMWARCDLTVSISCKFEISQIAKETQFSQISDLKILREEEIEE